MNALKVATALGVAALAGVLTAAPAAAHTSLVAAAPADGATVRPPAAVELTYADPVRFVGVVVLDARGGHHESGRPRAVDAKVTERIAGTLADGSYTVGWRVVAPDGHPVSGRYRFTVSGSAAPGTSSPVPQSSGGRTSAGWWWVALGALLLVGVGGGVARLRSTRS